MEILDTIDRSKLRTVALKRKVPITKLLLDKIKLISDTKGTKHTLLAVCPNSENVLKASLRSAKRANAPLKFAATLNQVDIDGGYTGWTPEALVRKIKEESYRIGYDGPIIIAVDHGGPWVKDIQTIKKWKLKKSMDWIKKSFEAALSAGYDLIHVDTTIDIFDREIKIETVVDRTIELIKHAEDYRKHKHLMPVSYEVGTEEVHGGLANIGIFKRFLKLLKKKLKNEGLGYLWPIFIVAKVGTDLHTSRFDPKTAKEVAEIVSIYGSYIKGHYTDFVENPGDYPHSGIGAANVGPEFTISEYEALSELSSLEVSLYMRNKIACLSGFMEKLTNAVMDSGRWKKWLLEGEKDFNSLTDERKEWIVKTSCRYVWAAPEVKSSQSVLYENLFRNGIDAEDWVMLKIESSIDRYFREFNLINLNKEIDHFI